MTAVATRRLRRSTCDAEPPLLAACDDLPVTMSWAVWRAPCDHVVAALPATPDRRRGGGPRRRPRPPPAVWRARCDHVVAALTATPDRRRGGDPMRSPRPAPRGCRDRSAWSAAGAASQDGRPFSRCPTGKSGSFLPPYELKPNECQKPSC